MVDNSYEKETEINQINQDDKLDQKGFWRKVKRFAQMAGQQVLEKALILYYVYQSDQIQKRYKVMIVGALGYFITTLDAVPDIMPMVGFADDLGILMAIAGAVASWVSPDIQQKVDDKLAQLFSKESNDQQNNETLEIDEGSKLERK